MRSVKPRMVTTFDLFVVVVVLGYVLAVVQSAMRGEGPKLRFAPSSQLQRDAVPAEWPAGAALTAVTVESEDRTY